MKINYSLFIVQYKYCQKWAQSPKWCLQITYLLTLSKEHSLYVEKFWDNGTNNWITKIVLKD